MTAFKKTVRALALLALLVPPALANSAPPASTNPLRPSRSPTVLEFFRRETEDRSRGGPGISRSPDAPPDDSFCIVTPGRREVVWHRQPLFVMQGPIDRMALRAAGQFPSLATSAAVPAADGSVITTFDDAALTPGRPYEWLFYDAEGILYVLPFSAMAAGEQWQQIAADLAQIQTELGDRGATEEAIAEAKATYFLDNAMPADALQVLFAVANPSPSLAELRAETVATICSFPLGL